MALTYEDKLAMRNDVDALLQQASDLHYMIACSENNKIAAGSTGDGTPYGGSSMMLTALLALKWPGVNPEWLRDLWIDLLEVPTTDAVMSMVESRLYRDDEFDPSTVACNYAERMTRAAMGDRVFDEAGGWTGEAEALYDLMYDGKYNEQTKAVKALAHDMSRPAYGK